MNVMFKLFYPKENNFFYATEGSSGFDICANHNAIIPAGAWIVISTGLTIIDSVLSFEDGSIPEIQIRCRSGLAVKHGVVVLGGINTIDCDFRGEIKVPLMNQSKHDYRITKGDRIAQGVCILTQRLNCVEVKKLERGKKGFGSTGK